MATTSLAAGTAACRVMMVVAILSTRPLPAESLAVASGSLIQPRFRPPVATGENNETSTTDRPKIPATYRVSFSSKIRPGMTLPVMVQLFSGGTTSSVEVSLRNGTNETIVFAAAPVTVVGGGGDGQIINLEIPRTLQAPDWTRGWFRYTVRVIGTGDVTFNRSVEVDFEHKSFSIFVQTDKAMYKPGQTVKIRVLAMQPSLMVINEPIDIFIRDPLGNGMKQWRQVSGVQDTGVVELSFPTSPFCPLGDWSIEVQVLKQKQNKVFTISKYVLPKFEVKLELPKLTHVSEAAVLGKVLAKYTFGKPLTDGDVLVTVKTSWFYYNPYSNMTQPNITFVGKLNSKGEMAFAVDLHRLKELYYNSSIYNHGVLKPADIQLTGTNFMVIANVTDVRTGEKAGSDGSMQFTDQRAKISFLPISADTYKPGLTYTGHVSVTKNDDSLFENYQNINVTFNVTIEVPRPTTTTPSTTLPTTAATDVNTSATGIKNFTDVELQPIEHIKMRRPGFWHQPYIPTDTIVLATFNKTLTANGFLQVDVDVPSYARDVRITATVLKASEMKIASQFNSGSGNYMQIESSTDKPKVGTMARFTVKTTEPVDSITYQLYAKGLLLTESKVMHVEGNAQRFNLAFEVSNKMAPSCRILVFYFRYDGEVVADSMSLKVTLSSDSQVGVTFDQAKVKPGEAVELTLTARPNSTVFLLSVDKSVQLLKSGNDLTQALVDEELMQYDFGSEGYGFWRYMVICGWPSRGRGSDAYSVFRSANVALLTDGDLYKKIEEKGHVKALRWKSGGAGEETQALDDSKNEAPFAPKPGHLNRVRNFFPETWLFATVFIGSEGRTLLPQIAPDTITTWLTSAFAVHPQYGLSVLSAPAELTTFRDVFVSLDLPYSAVRGEDLCLKAFAFNYHTEPLYMGLQMARQNSLSNIRLLRKSWNSQERVEHRMPMDVTHRVGKVYPDRVGESMFCFTPSALGEVTVQVNLTATTLDGSVFPGDGVEKVLMVEAEGVPRFQTQSVILDLKGGQPFVKTVPVKFPPEAVQGSQRLTASLAGDLLSSVFDNIDDLLRMPYGCGEQNMLYFAPNVFLIDYLQKTNSYTKELAQKAEDYMLKGYQKELTYQHTDGSYSAFGQHSNATGSMWLTAFVTKCFAQSMALKGDVVSVEPMIVARSLEWMMKRQEKNGSFTEPGKVFNKNMQGGSATGEALTAYVLIALAESRVDAVQGSRLNLSVLELAIGKAESYLESQLQHVQDSYDLAIVTYALHLTGSSKKDEAYQLLMQRAISEPLMLHWQRRKAATQELHWAWERQTDAINIEATAYGLLTLLRRQQLDKAFLAIRWLTSQRGPQGGFISTQDTVVGLQAFAQAATVIYQPSFAPIEVRVEWSANGQLASQSLSLDDSTKLLLQKIHIPLADNSIPPEIAVRAELANSTNFTGLAVVEVTLNYNVLEPTTSTNPTQGAVFSLVAKVITQDEENFLLRIEASRVDGKIGGMTTINVGIPTGYSVMEDHHLWNLGGARLAEISGGEYVLYFDEMGPKVVNVTLPMKLTTGVTVNAQPVPVQIIDYYESGGKAQMTVNYQLPKVKFICDRQPTYESCPYVSGSSGGKVSGLSGA